MEGFIFPLSMAPQGEKLKIVSLGGGRGLRARLSSMGLAVGSEIEVIRKGRPGPFIIRIKETRIAIGMGLAAKIMVSTSNGSISGGNIRPI
ncbi:MAG: ferrous iron transport protein A [Deltaproteobacteria bacterium]|nr:ferrous iron transport protein A [Deltaproteobacteria bacterium]RLA91656.1 MAG: ferrous iron transport protein A [Deltaproteobacteria bacterium]